MNSPARSIDDSPRATIRRVLKEAGCTDQIAEGYADLICEQFTGAMIYFAAREWQDLRTRDDRIRAERLAGRSWTWLSQTHCLSKTQVRRICESVTEKLEAS
jgi:hypothetical protein